MCSFYGRIRNVEAMRRLFATFDVAAQVVPPPGIFPDYVAPIIRDQDGTPTLAR